MGKFKVGDRVKVITMRFGERQYGCVGEIAMFVERPNLPIRVRFSNGGTNAYEARDLMLLEECLIMTDPEFDLDEIERAERLVHGH